MKNAELFSEMKATSRLAWPIIGAQLAQNGMVFVDNAMVGRMGTRELAAMAIATPFYVVCFVSAVGFLWGLSPLISQAAGAGDEDRIGQVWKHGGRYAFMYSLLIILAFQFSDHILLFLRQDPKLVPYAADFLRTIAWGVPGHLGYVCLRQLTEGTSNSKPSLLVGIGAFVLNFILDYLLIYGKFGFPRLGVVGSALATAMVGWLMFGAMVMYVRTHHRYGKIRAQRKTVRNNWKTYNEISRLGFPISAGWLGEVGFFCSATVFMGWIGTTEIAAHQIALNAASLAFMIPLGISMATSVRVGTAIGEKKWGKAELSGYVGFLLAAIAMTCTATLFLMFPRQVLGIYTKDPAVLKVGATLLVIGGIFQLFDGLQVAGAGALRGLQETRVPMINALVSYWLIGAPFSLFFAFPMKWGAVGIWWGMVAGLATAAALHFLRFKRSIRLLISSS